MSVKLVLSPLSPLCCFHSLDAGNYGTVPNVRQINQSDNCRLTEVITKDSIVDKFPRFAIIIL